MHWKLLLIAIALWAFASPALAEATESVTEAETAEPAEEPDAGNEDAGDGEKKPKKSAKEKLQQLRRDYQPYATNLYPYQPMYFAVGTDPEKSKFQVSFRYQFVKADGDLAKKHPWVTGFNLAYTQTSFWDLQSESKPFEDTSYKPEVFFLSPFIILGPKWAPGFQARSGFRHESNGRGGDASRSTNFIFSKFSWIFDLGEDFALLLSPEVYAFVANDDDTNKDLDDYRGYFDLQVMVAQKEGFALSTHYQQGTEGWSVKTDFTYPLHQFITKNIELYFFAQRFDGYAESLIDYRDNKHATRIGFSLIR